MNLSALMGDESANPVIGAPFSPSVCPSNRLLFAARNGDAAAFGALIGGHEARLLGQAQAMCRDQNLAEDLAQETLIEAWKSLHRYDPAACRLETWLYAILLRRHWKALRRARIRPFFCLDPAARDDALRRLRALEGSPAEAAVGQERAEALRQAVAALPEKHRQVIQLRFYADASLEEIAAALGCAPGTVKSRLHHALEKLRRLSVNLSPDLRDTSFKPPENTP